MKVEGVVLKLVCAQVVPSAARPVSISEVVMSAVRGGCSGGERGGAAAGWQRLAENAALTPAKEALLAGDLLGARPGRLEVRLELRDDRLVAQILVQAQLQRARLGNVCAGVRGRR